MSHERTVGHGRIELVQGDITRQELDAIANAANSSLMGGGGVDGAIHRAGGTSIKEECKRIVEADGPLPAGEAVLTGAGKLPCRYVVHTVGPVWTGGGQGEAETLANCYRNSLVVASTHGATSIAFPSIATGAYGYPVAAAAAVALATVKQVLEVGFPIKLVRFVLFSAADLEVYRKELERL